MARFILSITASLLLLWAGNSYAASVTIASGTGSTTAKVMATTPSGTEAGLVIRCASGCSGSGGTSATDNSAFTGGTTTVTPMGALYDLTPPTVTDGNVGVPVMDSSRRLIVTCASGCSGSTFADNAAFTFGTTTIQPISGVFDDVASNTATENSAAVVRITTNKGLHANLRNASGTEVGTSGAPLRIDPTGSTAQPITNSNMESYLSRLLSSALTSPSGGAAAATTGFIVGGRYLSTPPTLTNGQEVGLMFDSAGALKVSGAGGGTQYAEDTAHVSGDSMTMAGVLQQSADAAISTDGDRSMLQVDANGYLKVNIKAGAGSGGTAMTDDAAFTPATTSGTPAFFLFDDVTPDSVNEGDGGVGRMSANRNQYVTLRDAAGNERGLNIDASGNLTANITGSVTVTDGAGALNVICDSGCSGGSQYAEDAAETAGANLTMAGSVRRDTAASSAGTTGDNATINTDATGRLWVRPTGAITPAATFTNPTDAITVWSLSGCYNGTTWDPCSKATAGAGAVDSGTQRITWASDAPGIKAEDSAHTTADPGMVTLTKRTDTAATSAGTDGDYATLNTDATGRVWTNTELPDAAALADATSNPTTTGVASYNMCFNGTTWDRCLKGAAGNGTTDSSTQRVTLSSDSTGTVIATSATAANFLNRPDTSGATGAAPPARANFIGGIGSGATGGFLIGPAIADTFKPVSVTSATTTLLVTGVSGRHVRITSINLLSAIANNVALISGTGATCGTGTAGIAGGTTSTNGWNFAANGGLTMGSGIGTIMQTAATGDSVCVITSAAGPLAGSLSYAIY